MNWLLLGIGLLLTGSALCIYIAIAATRRAHRAEAISSGAVAALELVANPTTHDQQEAVREGERLMDAAIQSGTLVMKPTPVTVAYFVARAALTRQANIARTALGRVEERRNQWRE